MTTHTPHPAPAVSICVPTYNGMPYLPRTIESVLRQTRQDFELIVVNDASTDGTAEYLATLRDPRLRVEHNATNLGVAGTWTRVIDLATAPYVKLLCHDDLIAPTCLAEQMAALDSAPRAVLCTCWRRVINARDRVLTVRRSVSRRSGVHDAKTLLRRMVLRGQNMIGEPSAVLFRRSAWSAVRPYSDENLYMIDVSMWVRLLRHGDVSVVARPLCDFRISPTSLSATLASRQGYDARRFFRAVAAEHNIHRTRLMSGLIRTTLSAYVRHFIFSRQRTELDQNL